MTWALKLCLLQGLLRGLLHAFLSVTIGHVIGSLYCKLSSGRARCFTFQEAYAGLLRCLHCQSIAHCQRSIAKHTYRFLHGALRDQASSNTPAKLPERALQSSSALPACCAPERRGRTATTAHPVKVVSRQSDILGQSRKVAESFLNSQQIVNGSVKFFILWNSSNPSSLTRLNITSATSGDSTALAPSARRPEACIFWILEGRRQHQKKIGRCQQGSHTSFIGTAEPAIGCSPPRDTQKSDTRL